MMMVSSLQSNSPHTPTISSSRLQQDSSIRLDAIRTWSPSHRICFPTNTISNPKIARRRAYHVVKTMEKSNILGEYRGVGFEGIDEDDPDVCPVDCVKEFKTDEEFLGILEREKERDTLVVVDFYRTSCGSCKYIEQGFVKLCKGSSDGKATVIFLKHNVIDEYDEQSEVADRLRIKAVPLFQFYKNGVLLEAFPTRDKDRIVAAISKYTSDV